MKTKNNDNYFQENVLTCPYCTYDMMDCFYDGGLENDFGNRIEMSCGSCKKVFHVEQSIVFSAEMNCHLNDEKHDFEPYHGVYEDKYLWHVCTQCKAEETFEDRPNERIEE